MSTNVRVMTNVIYIGNENGYVSTRELIARLGYFELLELRRRSPLLYAGSEDNLTQRQRNERDGPRARNHTGITRLWNHRDDLSPMPIKAVVNPFVTLNQPSSEPQAYRSDERPSIPATQQVIIPTDHTTSSTGDKLHTVMVARGSTSSQADDPSPSIPVIQLGIERPDAPLSDTSEAKNADIETKGDPDSLENVSAPAPTFKLMDADDEQKGVIEAKGNTDLLVIAPPGTGKTYALIHRLTYLVESGLCENPLEEILVLSFSRAAVSEIRKRIQERISSGGDSRTLWAQVRTFDSMATYWLKRIMAPSELRSGYENRIIQFNEARKAGQLGDVLQEIKKIKYFLVDEVQDLNGPRAEMVLSLAFLIHHAGGSCTFLGDPAQAIYDFVELDQNAGLRSTEFLRRLMNGPHGIPSPEKLEFKNYRRFESDRMLDFVVKAREAMGPDGLEPDIFRLDELLRELGPPAKISELNELCNMEGSKAVLVRTNLEAYWFSEYCKANQIPSVLWRGKTGNYWPGWIGRLFLGFANDTMSLSMAERRWDTFIGEHEHMDFAKATIYLQEQGLIDNGNINLRELNHLIGSSAPVTDLNAHADSLVITTIHRSKGLEFDNVFLYVPRLGCGMAQDEVRIVYVAATRAKRMLHLIDRDDKLIRYGAKRQRGANTSVFQIRAYPKAPHIGLLLDGTDMVEPQGMLNIEGYDGVVNYLWKECHDKQLSITIVNGTIRHHNKVLAFISEKVQRDINRVSRLRRIDVPSLEGVNIVDLATAAHDQDEPDNKDKLGAACLSIIPVISGVAVI